MLGTIAYALVLTLALGTLLRLLSRGRLPSLLAWPLGLAFCWGVELWQLTGVPARLSSQWIGWRLTLGTSFDWVDIALYPVGVALAALALWAWDRMARRRSDPTRAGDAGASSEAHGRQGANGRWSADARGLLRGTAAWGFLGLALAASLAGAGWFQLWFSAFVAGQGDSADLVIGNALISVPYFAIALAAFGLFIATQDAGIAPELSPREQRRMRIALAASLAVTLVVTIALRGWLVPPLCFAGAAAQLVVLAWLREGGRPSRGSWGQAIAAVLASALTAVLAMIVWSALAVSLGRPAAFAPSWGLTLVVALVCLVLGALLGWGLSYILFPTRGTVTLGAAPTTSDPGPAGAHGGHRPTARSLLLPAALTLPLLAALVLLCVHTFAAIAHERAEYVEWSSVDESVP